MCITSLPYCPPQHSQQIPSLVHAAAAIDAQTLPTLPSSPLSPSASYSPISPQNPWFICEHPNTARTTNNNNHPSKANPANQTPPKTAQASKLSAPTTTMSTSPATCPNIEIRHPSFNGAKCIRCTDAARAAAAATKGVTQEEKGQMEMVRKLEEEIARLEGVVANMKRKLRSLTLAKEKDGDEGEGGTGEGLKDVLEGNLGSGSGGVL